ncbi:MAG: BspA family leucine-rich repeat surface protein, partial [Winogradskyella sp.]|uniref:BspA family leucine-rich repeat surface protein n=1 Tax=Winogradskyella sp. TaxID=1883156 RepID=UPI00385B5D41
MLNHYSKNVPFVFRQKKNLFLIQLIFVLILSTSLFGQTRFITTWDTTNPGTSNSTSITIPTIGAGYNYDVDWNSDGTFDEFGITGDVTHDFGAPGIYTIRIRGSFPRIYFNNSGDKDKIITIARWGAMSWTSMENAFYGCSNLIINTAAPDAPDLSLVTSMSGMFRDATNVNGAAAHWDVSNITDMSNLFRNALNFNQNLSAWNVSNVTNMSNMFNSNTNFNTNLSAWDVSNVTNMTDMLLDTALTTNSYDALLLAWNNLTLQSGVNFNAGLSNYCAGTAARNNMISNFGWSIIDNGSAGSPVTAICRTTPFNLLLDATGNAILDPSDIDNGSTVNCGGTLSLSVSQTNFSCADLGTNTILLTANDGNGNISTCTTTVEVISNIPPTPNTTILPNITAQCEVTTLDIPTATNTCGIVISGTHNTTFPITTIGTTIVTWTYDDGNGNVSTQDQNVIITDNIAPVTPTLTALTTDCNGTLTAPATTDVCAGIITGTTSDTLNFVEGGSTTITWTFDDGNGNTTTANQVYNYDDTTAPVTPALASLTVDCNGTLAAPTTTDICAGNITGTTTDTLNFV